MVALPFSIMTKPIGPRCNIDCKYCYYLEKEKLYPDEKKFRMSDEVLERYIRETIEAAQMAAMPEVSFAWQGGEPTLLGLDYFCKIVSLQHKYAPQGLPIYNALQTNGMLLDDSWGLFLAEHGFLTGLSIDGPKAVHDRYRVDRAGRPTFDAVMRGLDVLQRNGVAHNALTTVHRANGTKGKAIYRFLKGLGLEHIQFIPIVERKGQNGLAAAPQIETSSPHGVTDWSVAPRAYGKFLNDVFDLWYKTDVGQIFVQFFDVQLGLWAGRPAGLCVFAETCGNALALEHDGSLYACDHYVYPEYKLGSIAETPLREMLWSPGQQAFGQAKKTTLTAQCNACAFRFACNGGCPKQRFATAKDGEAGHNYFCESYMMFFKHAGARLQKMAWQINNGIPATGAVPKAARP